MDSNKIELLDRVGGSAPTNSSPRLSFSSVSVESQPFETSKLEEEKAVGTPTSLYGNNAPPHYNELTDNKKEPVLTNVLFKSVQTTEVVTVGLFKKILAFLACSITVTIILIILMVVPICMIIVGIIYVKSCPMEKMVPIWLIVFGSLSIVKNVSTLIQRIKMIVSKNKEESFSKFVNFFDSFMALFMIIWFICGNVWIYRHGGVVQFKNPHEKSTYCHQGPYLFVYWFIMAIYIVMACACFLFCCTVCCSLFIPTKEKKEIK